MHYLLASQGHRQRSRSYCMIVTWQRLNCNCGRWSANLCRYVVNVSFFPIASIPSVALDASSGLKAWHGREGCGLLLRNLRNRLWVGHNFTKNNNLKNTAPENMEFLVLYCFQWTRGLPTRLFIQLLPWLVYLQMWPPANSVLPQLPGSKLALFVAFTRIYF